MSFLWRSFLTFSLLLLAGQLCFAQQTKETALELAGSRDVNYPIDWKYQAGEFFIFDCERNHYACVNADGFANCREERNFAAEKKLSSYPCAPLKKFADKKSCMLKNYEIVDIMAIKRFCFPK